MQDDPKPDLGGEPEGAEALTVLIIDDHRMFAESLARLLGDEDDIDVVGIATTGAEGARLADELLPRVVLVDFQMPEQDGATIAAKLKAGHPSMMVIMLTGLDNDRVLLAAIDAGCSGFITKDRSADGVAEAIRSAAAGEAVISPTLLARLLPQLGRTGPRSVGADLTDREREILGLLARGSANKVIAAELFLSVNTVRNYIQSLLTKLGAHSKLEAVSTAVREGIIDFPTGS